MTIESNTRAAVIAALAERYPAGNLGRTAVMKLCYFLQTLRQLPLGYRFTLYSYGPFDSDVLADLDYAEAVGALTSKVVHFASGAYGYQIRPTEKVRSLENRATDFLRRYSDDIDWVIREFGNLASAQLELASTIVYADREVVRRGERQPIADLVQRVRSVKPHFTDAQVEELARALEEKHFLLSIA